MLVLTRREGDSLTIGDNIKVVILGIKGSQIKIGIEAPKEIQVLREEAIHKYKKD